MTNQDQPEQQAKTWHLVTIIPKYRTLDHWQHYICKCGETEAFEGVYLEDDPHPQGDLVIESDSVKLLRTIIANHQAQQRLQDLEAETQVQLIEAEQRIVQAQGELASLRAERDATDTWRDWKKLTELITNNANEWKARAETAQSQLATAVAALEDIGCLASVPCRIKSGGLKCSRCAALAATKQQGEDAEA